MGFCSTTRAQGGERRLSQERSLGKIYPAYFCVVISLFLGFLGIFAEHDTRFWNKETILSCQSVRSFYYCGLSFIIYDFVIKALKGEIFVTRYVSSWRIHCRVFSVHSSPPQRTFCGKSHFANFMETLGHTNFCGRPDVRDFFQSLAENIFVLEALFILSKAVSYFTILTQIIHFHLIKMQQGIQCTLVAMIAPFTKYWFCV